MNEEAQRTTRILALATREDYYQELDYLGTSRAKTPIHNVFQQVKEYYRNE